jgi:hypothetical protein
MKRLLVIGVIWFGCAAAWLVLGSTILVRSGATSSEQIEEVHLLWGRPLAQLPPRAQYRETVLRKERITRNDADGRPIETEITREQEVQTEVPVVGSDVAARLVLEHRRKGLNWFSTYTVDFRAHYAFENPTREPRRIEMAFPLATENTIYDDLQVLDSAGHPIASTIAGGFAQWADDFASGERHEYAISYRSRGTSTWHYQLTAGTGQVRNFHLTLDTNFANVDFPAGTVSPSNQHASGHAWHGEWTWKSLVANAPIGVALPERLNPGPLASRITFFAPVSLLFFFFVVAVFATAQRRSIHPLNYFFFGLAFFAFHLLFAYLVDHLAILPSFALASVVSIGLVTSYARLFVGWRFALREMGVAQLIYLVLFSFSFFWTGFTGLAITLGAVLTLFVMMQVTGRVKWEEANREIAAGAVAPIVPTR